MRKSIRRVLRDRVAEHFESQASDELYGIHVIKAFDGQALPESHVRVSTGSATPQIVGSKNLARWDVTLSISAVTQIDEADNDVHDNLVGLIEAYALQGNATLASAFTTTEIQVDNVYPSDAQEMAVEGMRYSSQELTIECYLKGA